MKNEEIRQIVRESVVDILSEASNNSNKLRSETVYYTYDLSEVLWKFEEISGWEVCEDGMWNAQFDKPVTVEVEYPEYATYKVTGQDFVVLLYSPEDEEVRTLDEMMAHSERKTEKGREYLKVGIRSIIAYLIDSGALPKNKSIMLKG